MSAETFGRGRRFAIGANVLVMIVLAIAAAVLVVFVTGFALVNAMLWFGGCTITAANLSMLEKQSRPAKHTTP